MTGLGLDLYNPEPVSLSQDSHGFVQGIKVVEIQRGHFGGPGTGIIKQMKEGIIAWGRINRTEFEINFPTLSAIKDGGR